MRAHRWVRVRSFLERSRGAPESWYCSACDSLVLSMSTSEAPDPGELARGGTLPDCDLERVRQVMAS